MPGAWSDLLLKMSDFVEGGVKPGTLLGMGNPLLDISAEVPEEVLKRCVTNMGRRSCRVLL